MPELVDPRQRAETALQASNSVLKSPADGSYENAAVLALIGIGHALLAVADQIRSTG